MLWVIMAAGLCRARRRKMEDCMPVPPHHGSNPVNLHAHVSGPGQESSGRHRPRSPTDLALSHACSLVSITLARATTVTAGSRTSAEVCDVNLYQEDCDRK